MKKNTFLVAFFYCCSAFAADYYCDSVAGDDGNTGTTSGDPFKTLAVLEAAISPLGGDNLYLKRGSHWREKLTIAYDHVTVDAYGTGDLPLIDASDVVPAGSWIKAPGCGYLYYAVVAVQTHALASEWVSVWVDGVRMKQADNCSSAELTRGTYFSTDPTVSPVTIFIHPFGDTDPRTDGKTYEVAVRSTGIDTFNAEYVDINHVHTRRNYASYGSVTLGRYCHLHDSQASEGNTHNVFLRGWAEAHDVVAYDGYAKTAQFIPFVYFENPASGEDVVFDGCTATMVTANPYDSVGFLGHGGGTFGNVYYTDCTTNGMIAAFEAEDTTKVFITNAVINGARIGIKTGADTDVNALTMTGTLSGGYVAVFNKAGITYNFTDVHATINSGGGGGIQSTLATSTLILNYSDITGAGLAIRLAGINSSATIDHVNFYAGTASRWRGYWMPAAGLTLSSDYNVFNGFTGDFVIGGTTYANFAAYVSGSGQDAHSTN